MAKRSKVAPVETPWQGLPKAFTPHGYEGFVYLIEHIPSGKKYIGRKYFWEKRRLKVKGKSRRVRTVKESNWRSYKSSSDVLKELFHDADQNDYQFSVLSLHTTRAATNYAEVKEQFLKDVLYARLPNGDYEYYNSNILARYFRSKEHVVKETESRLLLDTKTSKKKR